MRSTITPTTCANQVHKDLLILEMIENKTKLMGILLIQNAVT